MVTGRNIVLEAVGSTAAREYDVPAQPAGGLVLSMIRANVCGSDVHILNGGHPLVQPGCVMGHEGVGRVHALGEGVTTDFAGEPLEVLPGVPPLP
jgi:threonine dehydrogenase-like Zn-dependent dehydrogenase